ncbi:MAG: ABC transporter substrate-binding protein [Alphaproteobacteria bacterium]|nr:ABC transporter substrate-binding protein [Alphaproteobacteria bacterium]
MRRREFITLLGGTAAVWPVVARGQQAMPVVGFIHPTSSATFAYRFEAFKAGLRDFGYVEGRNVAFDVRWAEGQFERLPAFVTEMASHKVAVIVVATTVGALAARAAQAYTGSEASRA